MRPHWPTTSVDNIGRHTADIVTDVRHVFPHRSRTSVLVLATRSGSVHIGERHRSLYFRCAHSWCTSVSDVGRRLTVVVTDVRQVCKRSQRRTDQPKPSGNGSYAKPQNLFREHAPMRSVPPALQTPEGIHCGAKNRKLFSKLHF